MAPKKVKLEVGTVFQKEARGIYYFRYQVNGRRKLISLKTRNQDEAKAEAERMLPIIKAGNAEIIAAHVKHAKSIIKLKQSLSLLDAWKTYAKHPDRAVPATVHERNTYEATFREFIAFTQEPQMAIRDVTPEIAEEYAKHLKTTSISVSTHNRKITRIRKIFTVLKDYSDTDNPFLSKALLRKEREEQEHNVRRVAFSREQERQLLNALENPANRVMHKPEIRVIYYLGMYTGQRLKDCVLLKWDRIDLDRKRIHVRQFKTGKEVSIPIAQKLMTVLQEAMQWKSNEYVCPNVAARYSRTDAKEKNVGNNLVNIDVLRVIRWIGLEPSKDVEGRKKKVTVYGFHSLRHSFVSFCAEAGVSKATVLSILGTDSDIADKYYTHVDEGSQERAINLIDGHLETITDRERIEQALSLIDSCAKKSELLRKIADILGGAKNIK